ncbi:MAG: SMC-Scp complex subunit ScpB [Pseudomonadota bacterium]
MNDNELISIIEALLMASSKPLSVDKILALFSTMSDKVNMVDIPSKNKLLSLLSQLEALYKDKSIELKEVSSGFRFQIKSQYAPWISKLWEEKPQKYSRALLETLVLIAYRQPITRGDIEDIRGVSVSSQIIRTLVDREWIRVIGHRDVPGKPAMYATTRQFLDYFSLKKLDELPVLSELMDIEKINPELDFGLSVENKPVDIST